MGNLRLYRNTYSRQERHLAIQDFNYAARDLNAFDGTQPLREIDKFNGVADDSGKYRIIGQARLIRHHGNSFVVSLHLAQKLTSGRFGIEARVFDFTHGRALPFEFLEIFQGTNFVYSNRFSSHEIFERAEELSSLGDLFQHYGSTKERKRSAVVA